MKCRGALHVREILPEANLIFLTPPAVDVLENRLRGRGTETEEVIRNRMARAKEECSYMEQYDYIVVNDDLDECVENVHNLIRSASLQKRAAGGFYPENKTGV